MKRKIDELGRLVIPIEMRETIGLKNGDPVKIELEENKIIITNPSEVDYKERVNKAIEYIKENLCEEENGCGVWWYQLSDYTTPDELLNILKGE